MRRLIAWLLGGSLLLGASLPLRFDPERNVELAFREGAVLLTVPRGAHLKAAFMEVTLEPGTPGTLKAGPLPPPTAQDELGDGIWRDQVAIPLAGKGLPPSVELAVTYQPCTEGPGGVCFAPIVRKLVVPSREIPGPLPATRALAPRRGGLPWLFLLAFGFGLAASLSPCVYPMIPITLAIVGAKEGGKARGFGLALTLVLGMALTYTLLGVFAARTRAVFGAFAQSPAFLIPVSILFALFALSLLGAFEIRLPARVQSRLQGGSRKGFLGAFLIGLALGPLSAPCVGPFIGTVLVAIAQDGRVLLGTALLFTFALGMGVLFLAVGTFSATLPRSGDWLVKVKQLMGVVVLGFAVWTVRLVAPGWLLWALSAFTLLLAAPLLGAFEAPGGLGGGFRKGLGILALLLGLLAGVRAAEAGMNVELLFRPGAPGAPGAAAKGLWIEQDLEGALAQAKGKRVLVDTYAPWCALCKELDEDTWVDPRIRAWIQENAVAVRIDTDQVRKDLALKYAIQGYPTVLLLDEHGKELRRSVGFLKAGEMLAFLKG